jgi:hypothetical protein
MKTKRPVEPALDIQSLILTVREQKVILDCDLALIYGVPTKVLNQAIKRNKGRFPSDFMFRLKQDEVQDVLRSRSQILSSKHGQNPGWSMRSQIVTASKAPARISADSISKSTG